MKKLKRLFVICLLVVVQFIGSTITTNALSVDESSYELIVGEDKFQVQIHEVNQVRNVVVTDENGASSTAAYNLNSDILSIDGHNIDLYELPIDNTSTPWYTKVLNRTRYTLGPAVTNTATALIAGLTAISGIGAFATAIVSTVTSGALWGATIYVTISECRSGLKITSGTYAGKYKYWTNVLVECNDFVILDQNHSIYYK